MVTVGNTLTATAASVTGDPTPVRSWQWLRNGATISGATASSYVTVGADAGSQLSVRQIETNVAGVAVATSAATTTVQAFDPATLFASSEVGAWYDPSDSSTVWQDAAGTTPAGVGDPVGRIDDKSGNGNHATQTTSAARPVLQQSGGLYYLDFDGVDDWMSTGAFAAGAQAQPNTISCGYSINTRTGQHWIYGTPSGTALNGKYITSLDRLFAHAGSDLLLATYSLASNQISVINFNGSSSVGRLDGATVATGSTGTAAWGGVNLASYGSGAGKCDLHLYSYVGVNRTLTAGEISDLESYLATKSGVTL